MPMLMVHIREVRMRMHQRLVPVNMLMLSSCRYEKVMLMLVMFIVQMLVIVYQFVMKVRVFMVLGQVQPCA